MSQNIQNNTRQNTNLDFDLPLPQDLKNNQPRPQPNRENPSQDNTPRQEWSQEEREARERNRTELVLKCRDFIRDFIMKRAPGKMSYRLNVKKAKTAAIFRYSPPSSRGERTQYFSQVVIDKDTNQCSLAYFRPRNHPANLWFFPIFYMMNGFTKNSVRTFQALGLTPVEVELKEHFEPNYQLRFYYSRQYGNSVSVFMDVTPPGTPSRNQSDSPTPQQESPTEPPTQEPSTQEPPTESPTEPPTEQEESPSQEQ